MRPGPETEAGIREKPVCRSRPCPSQGVPIAHPVADSSIGQVLGRVGVGGRREAVNRTNRTHSLGEFTVGEGRHNQDNQEGTPIVWLRLANSRCNSAMEERGRQMPASERKGERYVW